MSNVCNGCGRSFSNRGGAFLQHLKRTSDPLCQEFAANLNLTRSHSSDVISTFLSNFGALQPQQMLDIDSHGDYFGDYDALDASVDVAVGSEVMLGDPEGTESDFESEDGDAAAAAECEDDWEAEIEREEIDWSNFHDGSDTSGHDTDMQIPVELPPAHPAPCIEPDTLRKPYVQHYPDPRAGAPLTTQTASTNAHEAYEQKLGQNHNVWAPFTSEIDWKVAKWAKMRGPGSTALTELLSIDGVSDRLGLSFKNAAELNRILDDNLPSRPQFQKQEVIVKGEVFEMYFRDILQCVRALYHDAEFAPYLKFAPERHFGDATQSDQLFHDMHTGQWWWSMQETIDKTAGPGRTIIPLIISSDKTQVTVFRNKTAYPVYLSIGNIPKELRRKPSKRAYILLGYLPSTRLEHIRSPASRRRCIANLFHACMKHIVKPLVDAGTLGTIMTSGDGVDRLTHPIFAVYIGDYPEQILVTCGITGYCPRCTIPRQRIGENVEPYPMRSLQAIRNTLEKVDEGASVFVKTCKDACIRPVFEPFWADLPYSNIFLSITPDILHQLYQGVLKHLKQWIIKAYGDHEIDARCRRLPPNHNIRVFMKGISTLSHITGQEHDQIARFLLGIIADAPLPGGMSNIRLLRCLRGLIDFLFLAQYPVHSDKTLNSMDAALQQFQDNKTIFRDLGIRSDFHIPKIHFLNHYVESVRMMGTFDNFNTEYTERLHIDYTKDAYRATNKKDEYPQMTTWLERREKVMAHNAHIEWRLSGKQPILRLHWIPPGCNTTRILHMTKHPSVQSVKIPDLVAKYGATFFSDAMSRFLVELANPNLSGRRLQDEIDYHFLGISSVHVFHRVKFLHHDLFTDSLSTADSIHAQPSRYDKCNHIIPGRFDTALVRVNDSQGFSNVTENFRVGQVRLIFSIGEKDMQTVYDGIPERDRPSYLAYVEWFTPFPRKDNNSGLYKVSRCNVEGGRLASVVDIRRLIRSVHLIPAFGRVAPRDWTSSTVLETCPAFFVNTDSDRHMYQLFA
ncbi:hypothetical protein VKT23_006595 [Stygiomarasmius scandens]|uniref:C2H2-type domain-containing protein n=1 Tax=Marasmiellus scandens TaxID=2682957 RepID=A0ABR1JTZ1_9AGAR